jgi:O-antigen ligase
MMSKLSSKQPVKIDRPLLIYIMGTSTLFALSYILNLASGPMFFGLGGLILASICVAIKGFRLPRRGSPLLITMLVIAIFNIPFAISPVQTGGRWIMAIGLYTCSLRLAEVPAASIRHTLEVTVPGGLLLQIGALIWHLNTNLDEEKTRLIWHTISLFAGLIVAVGLGYRVRRTGWCISAIGLGLIAVTGARGALVGIVGMLLAWLVCQYPGHRSRNAVAIVVLGAAALFFGGDAFEAYSGIKVVRDTDDPIEHMIKSFEGRTELVWNGFQFAKETPFFGTGLGPAYSDGFRELTGLGHPHNSYVAMLIELGFIFGPIYLFGSMLAFICSLTTKSASRLAVITSPALAYFLTRGMAENYSLLALGNFASSLMVLFIAISINHWRKRDNSEKSRAPRACGSVP